MRKPKELRFPNMDVFTERDLTRNHLPTRYGSVYLDIARDCLESGNLTQLYMFGGANLLKLHEVLNNGTFDKIRDEFCGQQLCKNSEVVVEQKEESLYSILLED